MAQEKSDDNYNAYLGNHEKFVWICGNKLCCKATNITVLLSALQLSCDVLVDYLKSTVGAAQ